MIQFSSLQIPVIEFDEEVSLLIGYKGMMTVAEANGVDVVTFRSVHNNEKILSLDLNSGSPPIHKIDVRPRGKIIGFYCSAVHRQTNFGRTVWMSAEQVKKQYNDEHPHCLHYKDQCPHRDMGVLEGYGKNAVIKKCLNQIGFSMSVKGFGFSQFRGKATEEIILGEASELLDFIKKEKGKELPAVATPTAQQEKQLNIFSD